MNRQSSLRAGFIVGMLAAIAMLGGCRDKADLQGGSAAVDEKPSPEESFGYIYETFRRGIETGVNGVEGGFVTDDGGGRTRMSVNNSVSRELIPPTSEDEPYRAKITVVSTSAYSLQRSDEGDDDAAGDEPKRSAFDGEEGNDTGAQVLDPSLISSTTTPAPESNRIVDPVMRRPDVSERVYELVHRNGRWELLTKLDEETEQSIISAFAEAFKTQI